MRRGWLAWPLHMPLITQRAVLLFSKRGISDAVFARGPGALRERANLAIKALLET